jgi:hypothetical protein
VLKKTITYKDFDNVEVTDDFYFHISKSELIKLQVSAGEGFRDYLMNVVKSGDGAKIIEEFERILRMAYGIRSADGKSFLKTPGAFEAFYGTDAYDQLFMELVTDAKASGEFINAIMPAGLVEEAAKINALTDDKPTGEEQEDKRPAWEMENRDPTRQELLAMTTEEMAEAMRRRVQKTSGD